MAAFSEKYPSNVKISACEALDASSWLFQVREHVLEIASSKNAWSIFKIRIIGREKGPFYFENLLPFWGKERLVLKLPFVCIIVCKDVPIDKTIFALKQLFVQGEYSQLSTR